MTAEIKSLSIQGYKSYRDIDAFEFRRITVLVGANGSGKTNLLSFFSLVRQMVSVPGEFAYAVAKEGGAGRLLHDGAKRTREIKSRLVVQENGDATTYEFTLEPASSDTFYIKEENFSSPTHGHFKSSLQGTHGFLNSVLTDPPFQLGEPMSRLIRSVFKGCVTYHFHDTSFDAQIRAKSSASDGLSLHGGGGNLAAFLHGLARGSDTTGNAIMRIQDRIRHVIPFFAEFVLEPIESFILLRWRELGSDVTFDASQASDGMLKIIALWTLLCQPPESLPPVLILDEPELGLHPQAITFLGALIRQAAKHCQVIVATQSAQLVDEFALDQIVVVSRENRESRLIRLTEEEYGHWLDEYSTGTLWKMNVFGGGPGE